MMSPAPLRLLSRSRTWILQTSNLWSPSQNTAMTTCARTYLSSAMMLSSSSQMHQKSSRDSLLPPKRLTFNMIKKSNKNASLFRSLTKEPQRAKAKLVKVEGLRLLQESLHAGWQPEILVCSEELTNQIEEMYDSGYSALSQTRMYFMDEQDMKQLMNFPRLPNVVACGHYPLASNLPLSKISIALACQDPYNMGSIIRTAVAHGFKDICVLPHACSPYNILSVKSSAGAIFHARFYTLAELSKKTEKHGTTRLLANAREGLPVVEALEDLEQDMHLMLVIGHETRGIPESLQNQGVNVHLALGNHLESLSASAAAAIFIHQLYSHLT
eukprot:m.161548 g.161548  ORF g.161548 m.161548 type:complete len:328 (-) comp16377_c4_seq10:333-1316(-)